MILGLKFILLLLCANAFAKPGFVKDQLNNIHDQIQEYQTQTPKNDDISEESQTLVRKWLNLIGVNEVWKIN